MSDWGNWGEFFFGFISEGLNKRIVKRVHRELAELMFLQGGMRERVDRLAAGLGSTFDLVAVDKLLKRTERQALRAESWLKNNQKNIAATLGVDVAHKIDAVVYRKMGAGAARDRLRQLVSNNSVSPVRAQEVLDEMDAFNQLLVELKLPR